MAGDIGGYSFFVYLWVGYHSSAYWDSPDLQMEVPNPSVPKHVYHITYIHFIMDYLSTSSDLSVFDLQVNLEGNELVKYLSGIFFRIRVSTISKIVTCIVHITVYARFRKLQTRKGVVHQE
jgi:hypothetical protein